MAATFVQIFVQNKKFAGNVYLESGMIRFRAHNRTNKYAMTAVAETPGSWILSFGRYGAYEVEKKRSKPLDNILYKSEMLAKHRAERNSETKAKPHKETTPKKVEIDGLGLVSIVRVSTLDGFVAMVESGERLYDITSAYPRKGVGMVVVVGGVEVPVKEFGACLSDYAQELAGAARHNKVEQRLEKLAAKFQQKLVREQEYYFGPQSPQGKKAQERQLREVFGKKQNADKNRAKQLKASQKAKAKLEEALLGI